MALKESLSRRKFLSGTGGALALTPMMGLNRFDLPANMAAAAQSTTIIKRKLGKTDIEVPVVSLGVMNADNPAVLQESYKLGIRLFDTARGYQNGRNEEMIGKVIRDLNVRNQVFIQTKARCPLQIKQSTPAQRKEALLAELDRSLAALQMDYVDIFLLHSPSDDEMNDSGLKEALLEMKKQKKARYIGIAHHAGQADVLNQMVKDGIYDTATVSFNFTMAQDTALINAIRNAAKAGLGIVIMKSQAAARGKQVGPPVNQTAALKWVLRHEGVVTAIPGYTNFDHMKEDFSVAYGLDYNNEEKKFLSERNLQASVPFCQQCDVCRQTCPKGVDIPTLMRAHMYVAGYGNFVHARATLDEIAGDVSLKNCADCSDCCAKCANYVGIADNIRDLKTLYL
jgi:predicted aldo/keto reductase-like oxidoreductase